MKDMQHRRKRERGEGKDKMEQINFNTVEEALLYLLVTKGDEEKYVEYCTVRGKALSEIFEAQEALFK